MHTRRIVRAFTIIELMVVIAIIGILVALGLFVAGKVSGVGKQRQTEQILRVLDSALAAFIQAEGNPPAFVAHPWERNENVLIPIIDGRNWMFTDPGVAAPDLQESMNNSVGLFMLQCEEVPDAAKKLADLDPKIIRSYDPLTTQGRALAPQPNTLVSFTGAPAQPPVALRVVPPLKTAMDGWGHPIRYVHPTFQGLITTNPAGGSSDPATEIAITTRIPPAPSGKVYAFTVVRRADNRYSNTEPNQPLPPDADGGIPLSNRPYFYSSGPDGDPATIDDNVYLTKPRFVPVP